jgi:SAM-dependent methyltransferase
MESAVFRQWCARLGLPCGLHRKFWEYCFIAQALFERDMLRPGRRGLGFGVGKEPLAALFASFGCEIVATDQASDQARQTGWAARNQYADQLDTLNEAGLCNADQFRRLVTHRAVDMNAIPKDLRHFDFTWSACSLEHLGSLEHGARFLMNMMECLKPGGVGVHTTEYNLSSDTATLTEGPTVLFRPRDIAAIAQRLRSQGHRIQLNLDAGDGMADRHVDLPPYTHNPHLKLQIETYIVTSIGLIIERRGPIASLIHRLRPRLPLRRAS